VTPPTSSAVSPEARKARRADPQATSEGVVSPKASSADATPQALDEEIRDVALRLLSVRARSAREMEESLREKGFEARRIPACVQWLQERGYLDDEEFAGAFIRDRVRFSPRSPFLLKRELEEKGVPRSLAQQVLDRVLEENAWTEGTLALRAAEGWVRKQGPESCRALLAPRFTKERERARKRLYGFLARRGFVGDALGLGMEAGEKAARDRTTNGAPPHDSPSEE